MTLFTTFVKRIHYMHKPKNSNTKTVNVLTPRSVVTFAGAMSGAMSRAMSRTIGAVMSVAIGVLLPSMASANLDITFRESAPKDSFIITNTSECTANNLIVNIDLSNSAGKLIFDTTAQGAGVEVFQPFEVKQGDITLATATIKDGQSKLSITINNLAPQGTASFTIDVDDTLKQSRLGNIRVANSEIMGGEVQAILSSANTSTTTSTSDKTTNNISSAIASFNNNSQAKVLVPLCSVS